MATIKFVRNVVLGRTFETIPFVTLVATYPVISRFIMFIEEPTCGTHCIILLIIWVTLREIEIQKKVLDIILLGWLSPCFPSHGCSCSLSTWRLPLPLLSLSFLPSCLSFFSLLCSLCFNLFFSSASSFSASLIFNWSITSSFVTHTCCWLPFFLLLILILEAWVTPEAH